MNPRQSSLLISSPPRSVCTEPYKASISRGAHGRQVDIDAAERVDHAYKRLEIDGDVMIDVCTKILFERCRQQSRALTGALVITKPRIAIEIGAAEFCPGAPGAEPANVHVQIPREREEFNASPNEIHPHQLDRVGRPDMLVAGARVIADQQMNIELGPPHTGAGLGGTLGCVAMGSAVAAGVEGGWAGTGALRAKRARIGITSPALRMMRVRSKRGEGRSSLTSFRLRSGRRAP